MNGAVRVVLLGVVAFAVGCAHSKKGAAAAGKSEAAQFYPLAVGNRWVYDVEMLQQKGEQAVEIVGQEKGFFRDSRGGELTVDAYGLRDQKRYLLREPIEVGQGWTNVVSVSSAEHYKVIDSGSPCEVPAGKFEGCVRVEARNRVDAKTTFINEFTFAPQVGIVAIETTVEAGGKRIPQGHLRLKEFKLARAP